MSHRPCARGLIFAPGSENWLLALRPSDWQSIHVVGSLHPDWEPMLRLMWSSKMTNLSSCPAQLDDFDICLACSLSPNLSQFVNLCEPLPLIILCRKKVRERFTRSVFRQLRMIHKANGGVTDAAGLFLLRGLQPLTIPPSVCQPLSSVIDLGLYVTHHPPASDALDPAVDLLPFYSPQRHVLVPRTRNSTELGSRMLAPQELCKVWGLPRGCNFDNISAVFSLVPLDLPLKVVDAALSSLPIPSVRIGTPALSPLHSKPKDPRGTFLPSLNKWLSLAWIDQSLITEGSRKADNAAVPKHLWDIRVCEPLGLSHCSLRVRRALRIIRQLLEDRLKINVIRSFVRFMDREHHDLWCLWADFPLHRFHYPFLFVSSIRDLRKLWDLRFHLRNLGGLCTSCTSGGSMRTHQNLFDTASPGNRACCSSSW